MINIEFKKDEIFELSDALVLKSLFHDDEEIKSLVDANQILYNACEKIWLALDRIEGAK